MRKKAGTPSLEAVDLHCVRSERKLFGALNFTLRGGELLRVGGANGSGKTSLLRIVCGLLEPTRGEVRWGGQGIRSLEEEFRRQLVYIGHADAIKEDLTPAENLQVACALAGVRTRPAQIGEALRRLGLAGCEHLPVRVLSRGQRRRVALARLALSEQVPLWVLDEPFTALDAAAMDCVRGMIAEQISGGASVIYTSHHGTEIAAGTVQRIELGSGPAA